MHTIRTKFKIIIMHYIINKKTLGFKTVDAIRVEGHLNMHASRGKVSTSKRKREN